MKRFIHITAILILLVVNLSTAGNAEQDSSKHRQTDNIPPSPLPVNAQFWKQPLLYAGAKPQQILMIAPETNFEKNE